uniref:Uncharacterized protein n=1 Tax=Sphaerodactylus townsendi TaxID=933632 RepID=A0ACB8FAH7_9SAUR
MVRTVTHFTDAETDTGNSKPSGPKETAARLKGFQRNETEGDLAITRGSSGRDSRQINSESDVGSRPPSGAGDGIL